MVVLVFVVYDNLIHFFTLVTKMFFGICLRSTRTTIPVPLVGSMRKISRSSKPLPGTSSRTLKSKVATPNVNDAIRADRIRLIFDGENRVISKIEALKYAMERGLDLVAVAPDADPVVCKLMDYSREAYKKRMAAKESKIRKKKMTMGQTKEIKMKGLIENHDLAIKCAKIADALSRHHPVKVIVTSNFRMLRQKPNSLKNLPTRLLAILDEKKVTYTVLNKSTQQTRFEMMLMPPKPS